MPANPAIRPKHAASLVVIRHDGATPRVLMGHRHERHVFMPNLWVFPGGRLERKDYRAKALSELSPKTTVELIKTARPTLARALAICAIREVFEETGIHIGDGALPDLAALTPAARAVTPPGHPRRFDTYFFTAPADAAHSLELGAGDGEFDDIAWIALNDVDARSPHAVTRMVLDRVLAAQS